MLAVAMVCMGFPDLYFGNYEAPLVNYDCATQRETLHEVTPVTIRQALGDVPCLVCT